MKGLNMILRKTFLFGTVAALLIGVFATSSSAQRRTRDRVPGPPSLSLMAEPTVIRNCEGDAATVRLERECDGEFRKRAALQVDRERWPDFRQWR